MWKSQGIREQIMQFDYTTRANLNSIRFDPKSKFAHRDALITQCRWLMQKGQDYYTRARHSKTGLVADLYCLGANEVVEFQDSESDKSIERKRKIWEANGYNFYAVKLEG